MALQSMTGFSRQEGTSGRYRWTWELRSVNGKGLDLRLRLPQGFERLEPVVRSTIAGHIGRGNLQVNLSVQVSEERVEAVVNHAALAAIMGLREQLKDVLDPAPLNINSLLSLRGIVDFKESGESPEELAALDKDIVCGLESAAAGIARMRETEGAKLAEILLSQVRQVEALVDVIESDPSRSPAEIRSKLVAQIDSLMEMAGGLDRERLHSEVALMATKADIREEIDRLKAHVSAARELLSKGGPVGRKLDFLAQEFNRESNTVCSKSNSVAVTAAGIELKVIVDQFREQVQNLE